MVSQQVNGFRGVGLGFRVPGSGFRVQGSGSWVQGSGFRVQGLPASRTLAAAVYLVKDLGVRV